MMPSMSYSGGTQSSEAKSGAKGNIGELGQTTSSGGDPGNRGFINNFAGEGSSLRADQGIGGAAWNPDFKSWLLPAGIGLGIVALAMYLRRKH